MARPSKQSRIEEWRNNYNYRKISEPLGIREDHPADRAIRFTSGITFEPTREAFKASFKAETNGFRATCHRAAAAAHREAARRLSEYILERPIHDSLARELKIAKESHQEAEEYHTDMAILATGRDPLTAEQMTKEEQPIMNKVPVAVNSRNDEVAKDLAGMTLDEMYEYAAKGLGCTSEVLKAKYGHLNPGLQRMNLGNRLRTKK